MMTAPTAFAKSNTNRIVRPGYWVRAALLLLAVASPALVRAQFQQPTAE